MYILLIHLSLMQAYNLLQLLYFSLEKVTEEGEGGGTNLTSDQTYPSVIHPPELDPALMTVYRYYIYIYIYIPLSIYLQISSYRDVTISINAAVIVSSLIALAALCQVRMLFVCGMDAVNR